MNLFNYWDNGTWEKTIINVESDGKYSLVKSSDFAFGGLFSGKIQTLISGAPAIGGLTIDLLSNITGANRFIPLSINTKYEIRARLYIPSGNPIATDVSPVGISVSGTGNLNVSSSPQTVLTFKDNWVEIVKEIEIGSTPGNATVSLIFLTVTGGLLNLNGLAYIDDVSITEIIVCDLAFSSPSHTKSNETNVDADDGTITINATSSATIEYSIDNINFQLSSSFIGLVPGTYTIYIRDNNAAGCGVLQVDDIIIQAFDPAPPPPPAGDDLVIDLKPLNDTNFLTWYAVNGDIGFSDISCINECWDIPNAYLNNKAKHSHYPIITSDEITSFYINFITDQNDPNHADLRLAIIDRTSIVADDVSPVLIAFHDDLVTYDIYADVDIPVLAAGIYRFIIYNVTDNLVSFITQEIELLTGDFNCVSTRIQFRNSLNLYGVRYEQLPNFLQQFRMRMYKIDEQTEGDISQYRSVSSGRLRNVHYELDRFIVLESYYFDKLGHRAMSAFQVHDTLLINLVQYLVKTLYTIENNQLLDINKGILELYEQDFSTSNRFGAIDDLVIVGSDDDLLLGDDGGFIKL